MGLSTRNYMKPTPKNWRKLGDGLLAVGTTLTATQIDGGDIWLAYGGLFFGVIGKFLTNFFSE